MSDEAVAAEVADILRRFFGGDQDKVAAWMSADNPMLGGISPLRMMILGRGDRLLRWMREAVAENEIDRPKGPVSGTLP